MLSEVLLQEPLAQMEGTERVAASHVGDSAAIFPRDPDTWLVRTQITKPIVDMWQSFSLVVGLYVGWTWGSRLLFSYLTGPTRVLITFRIHALSASQKSWPSLIWLLHLNSLP